MSDIIPKLDLDFKSLETKIENEWAHSAGYDSFITSQIFLKFFKEDSSILNISQNLVYSGLNPLSFN